ncbi:type II secretion system secretin GspD [Ectothiorhodospira shaposhnikovii]|uniref:type II secretion system secretin GspD n=1 Tax=Ectothiorhodospira shaposhnikovii TaxID=1054 RepID=UPI00190695CE|nr:type II secretion system secretin GspD [Ectothiorhodospira shaposhnikovii]
MHRSPVRITALAAGLLALAVLAGCAGPAPRPDAPTAPPASAERLARDAIPGPDRRITLRPEAETAEPAERRVEIYPGSGRLINPAALAPARRLPDGDISLNFENANVREVLSAVLEDMLGQNFTIAGNVDGRVTLQTTRPLAESAVLSTLEQVLHMNGIAMVHDPDQNLWRILRLQDAARAGHRLRLGRVGRPVPPGYQVRIMPLEYIAAAEMQKILEPLMAPGAEVRADRVRNLLIVTGVSRDLQAAEEAVDLFDVDLLQGMSVGLFPLDNIEPEVIAGELGQIMAAADDGPLAGLFRFIPMNRLGSVMVVTPQPRYLKEAETWIRRLDRAQGDARGRSVYVYRLQNSDAAAIAQVLNQLYDVNVQVPQRDSVLDGRDSARLAPGQATAELGRRGTGTTAATTSPTTTTTAAFTPGGNGVQGEGESELGNIRVVADTVNNALIVLAQAGDYENLRKILAELDIEPLQVLVDATIVEVTLTDELSFGLQWLFRDNLGSRTGEGIFAEGSSLARQFPGFNYSVIDAAGDVRAVLNALAEDERINVLSSPSLMVLDNRTAHLRVGDQVPVRTGESVSTSSDTPIVTSTISFRDTGVLLSVTPRVNAGGLVTMEVVQEVSDVSATQSSNIDSPTISTRDIQSTVAVQSGETIVLGGLIRENQRTLRRGIPVLKDIPLLGNVFRQSVDETRRTELIVLLTPRVAGDREAARAITDEYRRRLEGLEESFHHRGLLPGHAPRPPAGNDNPSEEPAASP